MSLLLQSSVSYNLRLIIKIVFFFVLGENSVRLVEKFLEFTFYLEIILILCLRADCVYCNRASTMVSLVACARQN
jgi:hypothetical protein